MPVVGGLLPVRLIGPLECNRPALSGFHGAVAGNNRCTVRIIDGIDKALRIDVAHDGGDSGLLLAASDFLGEWMIWPGAHVHVVACLQAVGFNECPAGGPLGFDLGSLPREKRIAGSEILSTLALNQTVPGDIDFALAAAIKVIEQLPTVTKQHAFRRSFCCRTVVHSVFVGS